MDKQQIAWFKQEENAPGLLTDEQIQEMLEQWAKVHLTDTFKEVSKAEEESKLVHFMQECRERTAYMKDSAKCEHCKLRFRCYTEIKVEKKRRTIIKRQK